MCFAGPTTESVDRDVADWCRVCEYEVHAERSYSLLDPQADLPPPAYA